MMYGHHMSAWGWTFSIVVTLLVIALVVAAVMWLLGNAAAAGERGQREDGEGGSAREILDRRLAKGEIDESEYGSLRAALSQAPDDRPAAPTTG